jgi:hypothetical protein
MCQLAFPHTPLTPLGIYGRAKERRQPPRYLNFDTAWAGSVADDSLHHLPHRFHRVGVAGTYAFGQSVLKLRQLFGNSVRAQLDGASRR